MVTKNIFGIFVVLSIIYIGITFGIPPDAASLNKYHLSTAQLQLIRFSVAVPIVVIWLIGYYGYSKFNRYAATVRDSPEGPAWKLLVDGLLALALWLPANSIIGNITSYISSRNSDMTASMTILVNYINLAILLLAFTLLYRGSRMLIINNKNPLSAVAENATAILLILVSGLFTYLTLRNPERRATVDALKKAAYYLPDWLLVITIIIPYIVLFYLGFQVVKNIYLYKRDVRGALYKKALQYLTYGLGFVVFSLLGLRYLSAVSNTFNDSTLKVILSVIYALILVIAAGYILIALGAKKLQKFEEV